ncbi:MAG TPA: phosphoenolpyruvate synthase, partial [Candidatus Sulfotelmatobacter sp.]|nr:phosphoenolpyruvate synthase [Candidatus Sulfotelmatobacter sp.]
MSDKKKDLVIWFENLRKDDVPIVGGKNASLGEMISAGLPVPPGFAVTAYSYEKFIQETRIAEKIYEVIKETVTDVNDPKQYDAASKKIRELIEKTPMPKEIEIAIKSAYKELNKRLNIKDTFVAVRSSATAEDLPDASFAGQQETFLNTKGIDDVLDKVVKCWSSLFTPRAIFYRNEKGFPHEKVFISVGVQKMVNSRAAGVMFTINPVTGDTSEIMIEGNYGLGESVVSGSVNPDDFIIDKKSLTVKSSRIAKKTVMYIRDLQTGKTIHKDVPEDEQKQVCINDDEVLKLANLATRIEAHYKKAMDIEWAIDRDLPYPENIFIVQARPETVWSGKTAEGAPRMEEERGKNKEELKVVVKGLAAGKRGYGYGTAKVVLSPDDAAKQMQKGDVLVTDMTNPDFVPFMKIASAIVTDKGGVTSHAAIVSRELAIPCIVGTEIATKVMEAGKQYTVDSRNGVVYEGILAEAAKPTQQQQAAGKAQVVMMGAAPVTATKIYMNLGVPDKVNDYLDLPFEGIGLMRTEFILASYIGEHP